MVFDLLLGIALLGFGCFTLAVRVLKLDVSSKAGVIADRSGERTDSALQFGIYTVFPLIAGVFFLISALIIG